MTYSASSGDRQATTKRPFGQRARVTNRPRQMVVSGRTAQGRRLKDLADAYAEQLGGWSSLSDTLAANVRRAAELTALAEQYRAEALRNGCGDLIGLARLEGCASRAVKVLGLPGGKFEASHVPLRERLAVEQAAK
jgi:hypothetical protein